MNLVVVSEHPCCRIGLATILKGVDAEATIVEVADVDALIERVGQHGSVDLVLMEGASQIGREMAAISRLQETEGVGSVILLHEQDQPEIVRRYLDMGGSCWRCKACAFWWSICSGVYSVEGRQWIWGAQLFV